MISDIKFLSMYLLAICIFIFGKKCPFKSFAKYLTYDYFFILLMLCITLIDLCMNYPCLPKSNIDSVITLPNNAFYELFMILTF